MKVAMYVRVSTQRQAQTQTIEQQLDRLREQSRNQGWLWCDEHIFRDDGYSGAKLRRPGLDRLRDQVRAGAFDRVIITAPDRLARNYVHQVLLMEELERGGCHVEFVEHPMSQDPHDQLLLQIRGAVAEYERSLIAERMRRGRQQKYQAGCLLPWTRPPYGYRVDPARPRDPAGARLEPDEAAVVAEIFETYAQEKQSLMGITKQLMERRVPTPSGRQRWNQATVHGIVSNPIYTGTVYIGRTRATEAHQRHSPLAPIGRVRGGHTRTDPAEWVAVAQVPPIVSQEVFDQVQVKLAQNQQFASRHNTTHAYLLRALVSCGVCHLSCMGRSSTAGYAYYTCRGKNQMIVSCRDEKCHSRFIPAGQLDELVWQDVCEVLTHPETIAAALQRAQGGHWLPQALQARRENLRKARVSLEHQIERLTDAYLATVLQLAEYKRRHQELEHRRHSIAEQVRQLEASVGRHDELAAMVQSIDAFCQRVQQGLAEATFDQRRQLIELLVDRVVVTGEEVEIRYVIPTSPTSEHLRFCHLRSDYFGLPACQAVLVCNDRSRVLACEVLISPDVVPVGVTVNHQQLATRQCSLHHLYHHCGIFRTEHCIAYYHVALRDDSVGIDLHPAEIFHFAQGAPENTYPFISTHFRDKKNAFGVHRMQPLFLSASLVVPSQVRHYQVKCEQQDTEQNKCAIASQRPGPPVIQCLAQLLTHIWRIQLQVRAEFSKVREHRAKVPCIAHTFRQNDSGIIIQVCHQHQLGRVGVPRH